MDEQRLHWLRHMLGVETPRDREPRPYRNYAAIEPGNGFFEAMAADGLVECCRRAANERGYDYWRCTDAGRAAAMASHKRIRLPKSKRVYRRWLDIRDALPDLTFRRFLTDPEFSETRRAA